MSGHKKFIPYGQQSIDESDVSAVCDVLHSPWLTTGPMVDKFEVALLERTGARFCVVYNSGTAALHAAYHAAGLGPGDEIITTPITFAATANAALYCGARPIFADIADNSFHIDPVKIEEAINPNTKAIVPVDMAGMPAPLEQIKEISAAHNLIVIEDASHALGASYKGRPIGSIADMSIFSFHPVKIITSGEGGAVTTDNAEYYQRLLAFRNHGIVRDPDFFIETDSKTDGGSWYYEQQDLGFNYRLPDINCALGLSQLSRLNDFLQRRREIADRYNEALKITSGLLLPPEPFGADSLNTSAWHLYIIRLAVDRPSRSQVIEKLREEGIGTQVHYIPVYLHPYYLKLGYRPGLCPQAEDYYKRCLTIPLFPAMTDAELERVIAAIIIALS